MFPSNNAYYVACSKSIIATRVRNVNIVAHSGTCEERVFLCDCVVLMKCSASAGVKTCLANLAKDQNFL